MEESTTTLEEELCNICMENILEPDDLSEEKNEDKFDLKSKLFKRLCKTYKEKYRMQTPCLHYFHTSIYISNFC